MSRLTQHSLESAPQDSRAWIERVTSRNGFLPNLVAVLANSPAALESYLTVGAISERSTLDAADREVVQITAASIHGCEFCVSGHSAIAINKAGLSPGTVRALQRRAPLADQRRDALVAFTRAVIVSRGDVADGELQAFWDAGFSEAQALDVVLGVSLATLCNFANNLSKVEINPELASFRPAALQA